MKVLVATKATQGQRDNDFSHTREGELVYFGSRCTAGFTDDHCGCWRSMVGAETLKATSTMQVVDWPINMKQWVDRIVAAEVKGKWGTASEMRPQAGKMARRIAEAVKGFPVGAIVEYRDDALAVRKEKRR